MEKMELKPGDVVQINPDSIYSYKGLGGALLVVTEPKSFGCQGYLLLDRQVYGLATYKGRAFLRPEFKDIELVGRLVWIYDDEQSEGLE
jgi:hypothetical protein